MSAGGRAVLRILLLCVMLVSTESWAAARHGYLGFFGGTLVADGLNTEKAEPVVVTLGHRFNSHIAFQLEYSQAEAFRTRVKAETVSGDEADCEVDYSSKAAYLMLIQPLGSWVDLNLKLGYLSLDYNFYDEDVAKGHFNRQGRSLGGGITYKLSRRLLLTADYTQLDDDAYHLMAGVELAL